jgi:hypothetical protein
MGQFVESPSITKQPLFGWVYLYIRYRDVMVGRLQKAKATSSIGANLVPKQPDTP